MNQLCFDMLTEIFSFNDPLDHGRIKRVCRRWRQTPLLGYVHKFNKNYTTTGRKLRLNPAFFELGPAYYFIAGIPRIVPRAILYKMGGTAMLKTERGVKLLSSTKGKMNGLLIDWSATGLMKLKKTYKNGRLLKAVEYNEEIGKREVERVYSEDPKTHTDTYYRPDGTVHHIENVTNDKLHGLCTIFSENGQIEREIMYKNGAKDGITEYKKFGYVFMEHYVNNQLAFTKKYCGDHLMQITEYIDGRLFSVKNYDENFNLTYSFTYQ